jgi:hypothetical protein
VATKLIAGPLSDEIDDALASTTGVLGDLRLLAGDDNCTYPQPAVLSFVVDAGNGDWKTQVPICWANTEVADEGSLTRAEGEAATGSG